MEHKNTTKELHIVALFGTHVVRGSSTNLAKVFSCTYITCRLLYACLESGALHWLRPIEHEGCAFNPIGCHVCSYSLSQVDPEELKEVQAQIKGGSGSGGKAASGSGAPKPIASGR